MSFLTGALTLLIAAGIALNPALSIGAAKGALTLCGGVLLPSLFPFLVCSFLIVETGAAASLGRFLDPVTRRIFNIGGAGAAAIFLGFVSGFPAGAQTAAALYGAGEIDRWEAERLLAFTNNPGPLFIIGAVGVGVFKSPPAGYLLLFANTLAALTCGFFWRFYGPRRRAARRCAPLKQKKPLGAVLGGAVNSAALSSITLCGFVVFFSVFMALLERYGLIPLAVRALTPLGLRAGTASALIKGFFELTLGVGAAGESGLWAAAFILGWGGGCVHLQSSSIIRAAGLSPKTHLLGRALAAPLAAVYARALSPLFPQSLAALSARQAFSSAVPAANKILFFLTIFLIFLAFFADCIKKLGRAKIKEI